MLALTITAANLASYLLLYTMYSKTSKTLEPSMLLDVLLARKGVDHTLVELNKAISLAGLTNVIIALAVSASLRSALLFYSLALLWTHSAYSTYKYYGAQHIPRLETWPNTLKELRSDEAKERLMGIKKVSLVFGSLGQILIGLTSWPAAGVAASIAHFYSMELDFKLRLGVRPYAYLPFVLAPLAIAYYSMA